jgi:hypothetical protein
MKTQTNTNLFFMTLTSLMLTACGGGFGNGGLTLNSSGVTAAQTGGEFSNYSSTVGSATDGESHSPSSADVLALISKPATEAEAFQAVDETHTQGMQMLAFNAGSFDGMNTFALLTSTGPAAASADPYGGTAPVTPVTPVNPIDNPPTGVDNPDTLPTLQASEAKKGSTGVRMVEIFKAGRPTLVGFLSAQDRAATVAEAKAAAEKLGKLNMTNLSAETQSLVQANILTFNAIASILQ